jgi:hypothetical protein
LPSPQGPTRAVRTATRANNFALFSLALTPSRRRTQMTHSILLLHNSVPCLRRRRCGRHALKTAPRHRTRHRRSLRRVRARTRRAPARRAARPPSRRCRARRAALPPERGPFPAPRPRSGARHRPPARRSRSRSRRAAGLLWCAQRRGCPAARRLSGPDCAAAARGTHRAADSIGLLLLLVAYEHLYLGARLGDDAQTLQKRAEGAQ